MFRAEVIFPRVMQMLLVVVLAAMAACTAGPPVQEMSNARQVIRAARDAGVSAGTNASLSEAEKLLSQAEAQIERGDYGAARRDAMAARDKAAEALRVVQARNANDNG
jgi:hypothetical protein